MRAEGVTVSGGENGICSTKKVLATNVSVTETAGRGILAGRSLRATALTASGNALAAWAHAAQLEESTLADNGIDLAVEKKPRLVTGSCETSRKLVDQQMTAETWGVCTAD